MTPNIPNVIGNNFVPEKLKSMLRQKHYIIAAVIISHSGWMPTVKKGVGDWVVITGFSKQWDKNKNNSMWNWVRINYPLNNREEHYPWKLFKGSLQTQGFPIIEIWPEKSSTLGGY